jgi:hypothetical protein
MKEDKELCLRFHGRILEQLGLQTYQSPVNAIAELVSNAWDADAEDVKIELPTQITEKSEIVIRDDGVGMTFEDCQNKYLNVGWNRRGTNPDERSPKHKRPILGRKGIGKFAGFGIARIITIETISEDNGESTTFQLDLNELLSNEFVSTAGKTVKVLHYEPPDDGKKGNHGTVIRLSGLSLLKTPSPSAFAKSMARRFLLIGQQANFKVAVDGIELPESFSLEGVEYVFPRDYRESEKPALIMGVDDQGWGTEKLENGREIRWRFLFHRDTIDEEELRGVAVFTKGKLAQAPFLFLLSGGLSGQHGVQYLSGQIQADYLDTLKDDLIATERQRINWEHPESRPLLEWGQKRVKELLRIWQDRRTEQREKAITEKIATFAKRLDKLSRHEAITVGKALRKLAQVPALSAEQFEELGNAILTAWEQGRLKELIDRISRAEELSEKELLNILLEAQVLTALNTAEAVKTKIHTVLGLRMRVVRKELEKAVRDYIALNPWLISPEWETFRVGRGVQKLVEDSAKEAGLSGEKWEGRIDLALSSGSHLLIIEFMRPGLTLDWDHVDRFERYVRIMRTKVEANTAGWFNDVTGYIVADGLEKNTALVNKIKDLKPHRMYAMDWDTLFNNALSQWREFLDILVSRSPQDDRLKSLL